MSPSPQSPAKRKKKSKKMKEKKKQKQKQLRDHEETLEALTTTSSSSKKRKNRPIEHGNDRNAEPKANKKRKKLRKSPDHHEGENGEKRKGGDNNAGGGGRRKRITDPRFASVHSDPRFQRMPRHHDKVAIDSRFAGVFKDERFALSTAPVDKRGKERKGKLRNPMLHYYVQEEEDEDRVKQDGMVGVGNVRGGEDAVPDGPVALRSDEEDEDREMRRDSSSSSSSSSSEDEDEDEEDDQDSIGSDIAHYLMGNHEDAPQIEEATRRLAVVNMDWDHIKAVDIYVVMRSCLPKEGHISSVAVYPSEFGLKCMEIERTQGPSALINGNQEKDDSDMEDSDAEIDTEKQNNKWRSYELNRLRYYYAVVDCDSIITANGLYEALDGTELLKTSNIFDVRFIPDSMEFTHPPRDVATEMPSNYKEPDFHTRALQHSNVKLSWEEDEPRRKILRRKFNSEQLDELEFKAFLASDDEDSDGDEDNENLHDGEAHELNKGEKYLALLQGAEGSDAEDGDQDMEISFNTGLEDIAKRVLEKKDHKSETVWEAYLRRRKEKRKARKENAKYSSDDDDDDDDDESESDYQQAPEHLDQHDDFFEEEHSDADVEVIKGKKGKKEKQSNKLEKDQEASQAELELLCANADSSEGPSEEEDTRSEKVEKKGKMLPSENKLPKEDYHDDPRFSALFTSHLYSLDPTDPQFKRSATYARQLIKKQKENSRIEQAAQNPLEQSRLPLEETTHETTASVQPDGNPSKKVQAEVFSVVRSLKRRTEALKGGKKEK